MLETFSGVFVALATIVICEFGSRYFTYRLMGVTILVAIAFIYVGFSLKGNPVSAIALECTIALGLYFLAIFGFTKNQQLIAYGIILHGIWDILHHHGFIVKTEVPMFWPSFCLIVDVIDGLYFLYIFRTRQAKESVQRNAKL